MGAHEEDHATLAAAYPAVARLSDGAAGRSFGRDTIQHQVVSASTEKVFVDIYERWGVSSQEDLDFILEYIVEPGDEVLIQFYPAQIRFSAEDVRIRFA
jgi:hypothetical protein